jgi:hypothetical protein
MMYVRVMLQVTLLDASANPGGLSSAFQTAGGQLVEPGIKGFWYQVGDAMLQGVTYVVTVNNRCAGFIWTR